ncbi:MAG: extracellular solute-binding protein [Alphaproteobacteria bacterium]
MRTLRVGERASASPLSRRAVSKRLAAAGLGLVVVPVVPRAARAATGEAIYYTWAGYDVPEFWPAYVEKHGATPEIPLFADNEEAFQKIRAGFVVDVTFPCSSMTPRWRDAGILQPVDTARLSNWPDVIDELKVLEGNQFEGAQWFIPIDWGQTSITYRTDLVDWQGQPESWSLLWDERYAGKLTMLAAAEDAWWCAAIYAGIDTKNVTEDGMAKVRALLKQQRPLLRQYTSDLTSVEQSLASGELVAAMTWNSSALQLKNEGVPVRFANPKEGALTWCCGLVLLKDAPHYDKAHDLIDAHLDPRSGAFEIMEFAYGHSNRKAYDGISDEDLAARGLSKNPLEILERGVFVGPQPPDIEQAINRDWEEIAAGF